MSVVSTQKRLTARDIMARKGHEKLVCLTAYTAPMAQLLDAHCDVLLVGDSVGMVLHGLPDTIGVTLEMMILHAQAVMRGSQRALVVVDMPFGSYEGGVQTAYANAVRVLKDTGAGAIKLESGPAVAETIAYLTQRGIPVMGHIGLRPQAMRVDGGFRVKGKTVESAQMVLDEARQTSEAGAFALVVEGVAAPLPPAHHSNGTGPWVAAAACGAACRAAISAAAGRIAAAARGTVGSFGRGDAHASRGGRGCGGRRRRLACDAEQWASRCRCDDRTLPRLCHRYAGAIHGADVRGRRRFHDYGDDF